MLFLLKYIVNNVVIKYIMAAAQIKSAVCKIIEAHS